MLRNPRKIALFDIDGTLTPFRSVAPQSIKDMLAKLKTKICIGTVGGSDLVKQQEQLGANVMNEVDYCFSQNGLVAFKDGRLIHSKNITDEYSNSQLNKFVNFTLRYIADLDIPVKRGTFIEFRSGMINVSPIGRNCSREERNEFEKYDNEHHIRSTMVDTLKSAFPEMNFTYSIGGQISFDVFPTGWDKTYCLRFLLDNFDEIHFFGDKTMVVIGHSVTCPEDTIKQVTDLFFNE
ncbi:hypothetical protein WA158_005395 [Blastocystis sp. Blastoise]